MENHTTPRSYSTDLQHFLDAAGEIISDMPKEARQLASFLALIVDEATEGTATKPRTLKLRCRNRDCTGKITAYMNGTDEVLWGCPTCGENGSIRNWAGTKWDRTAG